MFIVWGRGVYCVGKICLLSGEEVFVEWGEVFVVRGGVVCRVGKGCL